MSDAGNLQNLNDIVVPAAVPWWPPAPGWYVLLGVVAAVAAWLAVRYWRRRRRNRYRRQALLELSSIRNFSSGEKLRRLPALLKRAALSVWRREEVASLTGPAWHRFLDESAGTDQFCSGAGDTLDRLAYSGGGASTPAGPELRQVLDAAEFWLQNHQRPARDD